MSHVTSHIAFKMTQISHCIVCTYTSKHHTSYALMFNVTNKESQLSHIDTLLGWGGGIGKIYPLKSF